MLLDLLVEKRSTGLSLQTQLLIIIQRHRLVKGCGDKSNDSSNLGGIENSPPGRSDAMSDETDDSPKMSAKREL